MKFTCTFSTLFIVVACSCASEKSVVIGFGANSTSITTKIDNKTIVKSKIVELGFKSSSPTNSLLIIEIAKEKELVIQCEELVINQDIQFTGTDVTVIIEYEKLVAKNYHVNARVGDKGIYRLEKKKITF